MRRDDKYLELLKKNYPTQEAVAAEIINLSAILSMPKATEHFVSDIHGEYEAFCHLINTCSGVIREKVDLLYKNSLTEKECAHIASLIAYPKETIELWRERKDISDGKLRYYIEKLVIILLRVASKYTRSSAVKAFRPEFRYIMNEVINAERQGFDHEKFRSDAYGTILALHRGAAFIEALCSAIKRLAVTNLHIVGDIFDRGEHPDKILDLLLERDNVDIQWGNHDIEWIGAGLGNKACMTSVICIALKSGNVEAIEDGYGISLRRLEEFARKNYDADPRFAPAFSDGLTEREARIYSRMRKAAFYMNQKAEAEIIRRNPDWGMSDRVNLEMIDRTRGVYVARDGREFFNPDFQAEFSKPGFSEAENEVMEHLSRTFRTSEKLQKHIDFLMRRGGLYKIANGNLLYHGCVPFDSDGNFAKKRLRCGEFSGKEYFDACERIVRRAYANRLRGGRDDYDLDFFWYLWCGPLSPLFGRERITTFERLYLPSEYWVEKKNPYYEFAERKEVCEKILADFGVKSPNSHIINGHVPVKARQGESPIRAGGKLLVIDGGFCKAYQPQTGIAGYTLIFNSYGLRLSAHEAFSTIDDAVRNCKDIHSKVTVFEHAERRLTVRDTDKGRELAERVKDLKALLKLGI